MSISYRLSEIENAIPYGDVNAKWAQTSRDKWLAQILEQHASGVKLAELTVELMDAFTPACKKFLWADDDGGFARVREQAAKAAMTSKKAVVAEGSLRQVRRAILLPNGRPRAHEPIASGATDAFRANTQRAPSVLPDRAHATPPFSRGSGLSHGAPHCHIMRAEQYKGALDQYPSAPHCVRSWQAIAELERRAIPPPDPSEREMLGRGPGRA